MDTNKFNNSCGTGSFSNGWSGKFGNKNEHEESPVEVSAAVLVSTDDDDETEDEYCVYTYKGDSKGDQHLADLPLSFFKFDSSDSQPGPSHGGETSGASVNHPANNLVPNGLRFQGGNGLVENGARGDIFSPDMDFLEMDFDPGGNGEEEDGEDEEFSEEDDQEIELPADRMDHPVRNIRENRSSGLSSNAINGLQREQVNSDISDNLLNSNRKSSNYSRSPCKSTTSSHNENYIPSKQNNYLSEQPHCSKSVLNKNATVQTQLVLNSIRNTIKNSDSEFPVSNSVGEHHITLRLVKSNTLPELGTNKDSDVNKNNMCPSSRSEISNSAPMSLAEPNYFASINTSKSSNDSVELAVRGVMIWTVEVALDKSFGQVGRSACGATAILNVLSALGINDVTPEKTNICVGTRPRAEDAELPEYLFSRWDAGATHDDLIHGIHMASKGCIYGRFFHPKENMPPEKFSKWLLQWICKGAVPVATRNMQINPSGPDNIPDAWHHQMIFGISSEGIFMTNPIELVPTEFVLPQLSSPSILLIRRQDVIERKGLRTDLRKLARNSNPRWNEMNVLGQVANMFLEEMPVFNGSSVVKRVRSSHISIPARYVGGITLFIKRDSPSYELLLNAPDL